MGWWRYLDRRVTAWPRPIAMRYSLRTLVLLTLLGPPLLAVALIYGDRPARDFLRWLNRPPGSVRVITVIQPTQRMPDEGNPNPK